jgi:DSF synthase
MGAYSFLDRRIGQRGAEELITSGRIYSAQEMFEKGVVDIVVEDSQGETEIAALIERRKRSQNGLVALGQTRRRVHRIQYTELLDVVEIWVNSALRLNPRDLKLMNRLVTRQNGLGESHQLH